MANSLYNSGRNAFLNAQINYLNDNIKMALISDSYIPNLSIDTYFSEVAAYVIGTPQSLVNKSANGGVANCSDVIFPTVASGDTIAYLVIYKDTGNNATSRLIALFDTIPGIPFVTNGSSITINIDTGANKLFKL